MALNKRQYTDGQTIITAANLNEIQDCIITLENNYVPKTRTVAGKALSSNITLAASDVGAVPTSRTINAKALTGNITLSAADVGAVPVARTVNGKALSSNITLNAADVSAVPTTRTVNSKALSSNITLASGDIGDDSDAGGSTVKASLSLLKSSINSSVNDKGDLSITNIDQIKSLDVGVYRIAGGDLAIFPHQYGDLVIIKGSIYSLALFIPVSNTNGAAVYRRSWNNSTNSWYEATWQSSIPSSFLPLSIERGGTGATNATNARRALELAYVSGDSFVINASTFFNGIITTYATAVYGCIVVDKSLENVSTITVGKALGRIMGVSGSLDNLQANTDFTSGDYTATATKQSDHIVRIAITKSSAFANATSNTPIVYFGTVTLNFT